MECKHQRLMQINVVVIAGVLNRKMIVCKDCGKVIKVEEYEVD
jgi:hypothetical protein